MFGHPVLAEVLKWGTLLVLAVVAAVVVTRWVRRVTAAEPAGVDEEALLLEFQELHRAGKLSLEEYRGIRQRLVEQLRRRSGEASGGEQGQQPGS